MRGVYTANIKVTGLNSARTLLYITAPSTKVVEIIAAHVTNESNETNEQNSCSWQLVSSLGTPTATTLTPTKHEQGDQAAGSTVKGNVTASEPTYTSSPAATHVGKRGFATLDGYHYEPIPEERLVIAPSATWGLSMLTTPTSFDAEVEVIFREIG